MEKGDKFKIGRIKGFGDVWQSKLFDLLNNKKMTFTRVARELNCDIGTVRKYANNLQGEFVENPNVSSLVLQKKDQNG
ncbi:hypothetical protein KHA80_09245 [Anaerobacillus sp. HL2]|nr:hypothetical protein KHA80_09245 [Anaerobacillus sp. HL2]